MSLNSQESEESEDEQTQMEVAAAALVVASQTPKETVVKEEVEATSQVPPSLQPPVLATPIESTVYANVHGETLLFTFNHALCGMSLCGPVSRYKNKPIVEITNQPESFLAMGLHNFRTANKEKGTLFAKHAGECYTTSARAISCSVMPFLFLQTFLGPVQAFISSLPVVQFNVPHPDMPVYQHVVRAYQGLFGHPFAMFRPGVPSIHYPEVRPDILNYLVIFLGTLLGIGKSNCRVMFYMNFYAVDIRGPWENYELDTGLPRHEMIGGNWWIRFKVRRTRGLGCRSSLATNLPSECNLSPFVKVTRGYKYAMHVVLRGSMIFKAAGYPPNTLNIGEAIVHPIKYYVRLTPPHGAKFRDILTILV